MTFDLPPIPLLASSYFPARLSRRLPGLDTFPSHFKIAIDQLPSASTDKLTPLAWLPSLRSYSERPFPPASKNLCVKAYRRGLPAYIFLSQRSA